MFESFLAKLGNNIFTWDILLGISFILFLATYLYKKRDSVKFEKMAFPILYAILHRGDYGIKWMEKFAKKNSEGIKIFGYCSIGFGFLGMILAIWMIIEVVKTTIFSPQTKTVAPFLPFVEIPVFGYISFTHWILTLFIIVIIHEMAHGLVSIAHNLKVKNTGFGLFAIGIPFLPAAFVEPNEEELKKKPDYIQYSILAAGPMANFVLAIPLILLMIFAIAPIEKNMTEIDGFSFKAIDNEEYPAHQQNISNIIFNEINGKKVNSWSEFYEYMKWVKPNEELNFSYKNKDTNSESITAYSYTLKTIAHPDDNQKGFIGVNEVKTNTIIKENAIKYADIFSWFKGLINLLFTITLSLGIINLFPAAMTDGGQMFRIALNKISPNKERDNKIIAILAIIFLGIILFSFITYFTGNPFSLLK